MKKEEVHSRIEEIGIVPAIRASSTENARFAAEAVYRGGIPVVEIGMTVPGALDLVTSLANSFPEMLVGVGSVLDTDTARWKPERNLSPRTGSISMWWNMP